MKLLLDGHVAKKAVVALRRCQPGLDAQHLADWRDGERLESPDELILADCHRAGRVFVTDDLRTIPDLLRQWAEAERPHDGVVFADENTVRPDQPGAVAAALAALTDEIGMADTTNLVRFLRPARR